MLPSVQARGGTAGLLVSLAESIETIEGRIAWQPRGRRPQEVIVPTGWPQVDAVLSRSPDSGGLTRGAIHEWIGAPVGAHRHQGHASSDWLPPLSILIHLAHQALQTSADSNHRLVLWIGRRCWPYPLALAAAADRTLLDRSIFVDTRNHAERLWAIDLVLRSPATSVVIADGSGLKMAHSRRLQLAAAAGDALGLLARPEWERTDLSAARTRWLIHSAASSTNQPRWNVELLRCKGGQPVIGGTRQWTVQKDYETGTVDLVADVADRPRQTTLAAMRRTA